MSNLLQAAIQMSRNRAALRCACAWLALLSALLFGVRDACAADALSKEYQIKAAFLYNFTKFVEWPAQSFADASSPIVIGVYCAEPFRAELQTIVTGRKVSGREIVVKQFDAVGQATSAQLVFICSVADAQFDGVRAAILSAPVLTAGETDSFGRLGGVINFVLDGDKVRFEINMRAADRAGVKISAQLQKLAKAVKRTP